MSILTDISENLQKGKAKVVKELVQQAIDQGIPVEQILDEGLLSGMNVVGEKFKNNEVFVPEVLVAARAMNMGAQLLKPLLAEAGVKASGKVCIGTVQGDLHDIGKNLVKMMMEGKGLEVIEASWLFGMGPEDIDVVVHRESIVHSLIQYQDNSVIAQLGLPDMCIPIQYALTYPPGTPPVGGAGPGRRGEPHLR